MVSPLRSSSSRWRGAFAGGGGENTSEAIPELGLGVCAQMLTSDNTAPAKNSKRFEYLFITNSIDPAGEWKTAAWMSVNRRTPVSFARFSLVSEGYDEA
jgi:hypothetical protein